VIDRLLCVGLGVYGGAASAVLHRQRASLLGIELPWGLLFAIALAVLIAVTAQSRRRFGGLWSGAGWLVPTLLMQTGDDVWVGDDALGWSFLLIPLLCFAATAWWSVRRTVPATS